MRGPNVFVVVVVGARHVLLECVGTLDRPKSLVFSETLSLERERERERERLSFRNRTGPRVSNWERDGALFEKARFKRLSKARNKNAHTHSFSNKSGGNEPALATLFEAGSRGDPSGTVRRRRSPVARRRTRPRATRAKTHSFKVRQRGERRLTRSGTERKRLLNETNVTLRELCVSSFNQDVWGETKIKARTLARSLARSRKSVGTARVASRFEL